MKLKKSQDKAKKSCDREQKTMSNKSNPKIKKQKKVAAIHILKSWLGLDIFPLLHSLKNWLQKLLNSYSNLLIYTGAWFHMLAQNGIPAQGTSQCSWKWTIAAYYGKAKVNNMEAGTMFVIVAQAFLLPPVSKPTLLWHFFSSCLWSVLGSESRRWFSSGVND